jgi:hypothetical protein
MTTKELNHTDSGEAWLDEQRRLDQQAIIRAEDLARAECRQQEAAGFWTPARKKRIAGWIGAGAMLLLANYLVRWITHH